VVEAEAKNKDQNYNSFDARLFFHLLLLHHCSLFTLAAFIGLDRRLRLNLPLSHAGRRCTHCCIAFPSHELHHFMEALRRHGVHVQHATNGAFKAEDWRGRSGLQCC
jgi:hypothetical protein